MDPQGNPVPPSDFTPPVGPTPEDTNTDGMDFRMDANKNTAKVNPFTGKPVDQPAETTIPQVDAMKNAMKQANDEAAKMTEPLTNPQKIAAEKAAAEEEARRRAEEEEMARINAKEDKSIIPDNPVVVAPDLSMAAPAAPVETPVVDPVASAAAPTPETPVAEPIAPVEASVAEPILAPEQTPAEPIEPTPAEVPVAETSTDTPAAPVAPETPAAPAAPATPATADADKKPFFKNKLFVIIASIIVALAVIGGSVAAMVISSKNNAPEKIALDAVTNLINAKTVALSGSIKFVNENAGKDDIVYEEQEPDFDFDDYGFSYNASMNLASFTVDLNNTQSGANLSNSATITLESIDGEKFSIKAENIYISDGTIYLKISGFEKLLKEALPDYKEYGLDKLDDTWWKISIPEIVERLEEMLGETANGAKEQYACQVAVINDLANNTQPIADLYQKHEFVSIQDHSGNEISVNDGKAYVMTIDSTNLTNFINGMNDLDAVGKYNSCISSVDSDVDPLKFEAKEKDVAEVFSAEDTPKFIVGINNQRQLTNLYSHYSEDGVKATVDLKLSYPENATISAPSDSESVADLVESIVETLMYQYMYGDIEIDYDDYDFGDLEENCKDMMNCSFSYEGTLDFSDADIYEYYDF